MKTQTIILLVVGVAVLGAIAYLVLKPKAVGSISSTTTQTGGGTGLLNAIAGLYSTKSIASALASNTASSNTSTPTNTGRPTAPTT